MIKQATLCGTEYTETVSIGAAAESLRVSEATVRNWIKTGYLTQVGKGSVTKESMENFCENIAGKDKLTKRANKSLVDDHDHEALTANILARLDSNENPEVLGVEYESSLSNAYRNTEGVYYTPETICGDMISDCPQPKAGETFCDPCCGSGNFILAAIRHGFRPENVFGYDIDPVAVRITQCRIFATTGYFSKNIICANFLESQSKSYIDIQSYTAIATNPPWGKKLLKSEKLEYSHLLRAGKSLDTCSLFFFASLTALQENGFLSLLLPDSFFNITSFQDARSALLRHSLVAIRNFGKPFRGLLTRAISIAMSKKDTPSPKTTCYDVNGSSTHRLQSTFVENPNKIINFDCSTEESFVISRIFSKPHLTLACNAKWGLGIVTGNNKKYCSKEQQANYIPVYTGSDVHKDRLSMPTTYIPNDLKLYQQVAPVELFESKEKLLYRFISSSLIFHHDTNQAYFLNSVNMVIVSDAFPCPMSRIAALFNTELYSWIFSKLFNTHKVLRADLEKLPIPTEFLNQQESFSEQELLDYYQIERTAHGTYRIKN